MDHSLKEAFWQNFVRSMELNEDSHPSTIPSSMELNRIVFSRLKKNLVQTGANKGTWPEELQTVLCSLCTTLSRTTGETPFALVYGAEVVLPVEIGLPSYRHRGIDDAENSQRMREEANFRDELRDNALFKMVQYKHLMAHSYNRRVQNRQFKVGDLVMRLYAVYKVTMVVEPSTYELSHIDGKLIDHTWQATKLRKYHI
ncbi:hypothetical protein LIER_22321 [Lithospermum erythrorhizon]|uniref:Uncharacterized protein n=1 Tax=Lithospermum erythrorhizon TaxID=34254 RepID=A0AAV3QWJ8_LITER